MNGHDTFCNVQAWKDAGLPPGGLKRLCNCAYIARIRVDEAIKSGCRVAELDVPIANQTLGLKRFWTRAIAAARGEDTTNE